MQIITLCFPFKYPIYLTLSTILWQQQQDIMRRDWTPHADHKNITAVAPSTNMD